MHLPGILRFRLIHCLTAFAVITLHTTSAIAQESDDKKDPELTPVTVTDHVAEISAENTTVEFVGIHVGDDPRPRLGGFKEFSGTIELDETDSAIQSIQVEFQIDSIWTEFDNLTKHLMAADFFEVREYPNASFVSKKVSAADEDGMVTVTGDLTIHGTTGEMSFDCQPKIDDDALTLHGKFTIDRTKFGLDKMTDGVHPEVSIEVYVGRKTEPRKSAPATGNNK